MMYLRGMGDVTPVQPSVGPTAGGCFSLLGKNEVWGCAGPLSITTWLLFGGAALMLLGGGKGKR